MPIPAGITTATVTWGSLLSFAGEGAKVRVDVTPILGGTAKSIVWAATGQTLVDFTDTYVADAAELSWESPHVDQAGFIDGNGDAATMWAYKAVASVRMGSQRRTFTKTYQVLVGQTDIDLDLVPDGTVAEPVVGPNQWALATDLDAEIARALAAEAAIEASDVDSVAGLTGTVTAAGLKTALSLPTDTAGDIAAEVARATAAEGALDGRLDTIEADYTTSAELAAGVAPKITGAAVSTDASFSLPAPTGVGLEFVITADALDDIRLNGVSL